MEALQLTFDFTKKKRKPGPKVEPLRPCNGLGPNGGGCPRWFHPTAKYRLICPVCRQLPSWKNSENG